MASPSKPMDLYKKSDYLHKPNKWCQTLKYQNNLSLTPSHSVPVTTEGLG